MAGMLLPLIFTVLWGSDWAQYRKDQKRGHTKSQSQDPTFLLTVQKEVTVPVGLCVLVPCSFSYPKKDWTDTTPAYGYWFRDGTDTAKGFPVATNHPDRRVETWLQDRFQLVGNPRDYKCSLLITKAQREDSTRYFFRVERGTYVQFNFEKNKFYLNVTDQIQKPVVYIPETLEPGQQVTAICVFELDLALCEALTFSWSGAAVPSPEVSVTTTHVSVLTFTPRSRDHDTNLICRVDFPGSRVNIQNSVRLNVGYAPEVPIIRVSLGNGSVVEPQRDSPRLQVQKGQFIRLLCEADSRPPATLSWTQGNRVLSWSHLSGSQSLELVLPRVKPEDTGSYTCKAENRLGFQSCSLNLSVQHAPENMTVMVSRADNTVQETLRNGASLQVLEGQNLSLRCVTHSNPAARLSWVWPGGAVSPSQPSDSGVLELSQIQIEQEGEFICHAQNTLGSLQFSLSLSVHYPPQLLGPSCSWEDERLNCSCSSRAQPAPSLRWRLGEGLLEENLSNASYTVTSSSAGPWANSSLSLRAGLSAGLRLSCDVDNVHKARSATVLLLPEKKRLSSKGFSKGVALGTGVTALLILCLILVTVKILRKKQRTQAETPIHAETQRPRVTRSSTILDYINVVPNADRLARNRRAKPCSPSRMPSAEANPPGPISPPPAPGSENNQDEIHYAALRFSGCRTQEPEGGSEYAEIRFH